MLSKSIRTSFWVTVFLAGFVFWIPTYPPMIDVPQHAGQVALLLDIISNDHHRTGDYYLNILTPYWLGYGLWALLAQIFTLVASLKILLTLTYWLYILASVNLRKEAKADPRLDWLLIPAFFGFSFKFGFLTFLMASPLVILMLVCTLKHCEKTSRKSSFILIIGGALLFCSHALAFLYWLASSYLILLVHSDIKLLKRKKLIPLLILSVLPPLYFTLFKLNPTNDQIISSHSVIWHYDSPRYLELLIYPYGAPGNSPMDMYIFILMMVSPLLLKSKIKFAQPIFAPFALLLSLWFLAPDYAMKTEFLYERFSLIFIPLYICLFTLTSKSKKLSTSKPSRTIIHLAIPLLSLYTMLSIAWQFYLFDKETIVFSSVLNKIPEKGRLLSIIQDQSSPAARNITLYTNFGSWYQAEKKGTTDFSFAWFPPQPIRFKKENLPDISPTMPSNIKSIHWSKFDASRYDYFLIRKIASDKSLLIPHQCTKLIADAGGWSAYARISCSD